VGMTTRASAGFKIVGVAASLGACAPFVVIAILSQRVLRKRTARLARLAAASLEPLSRAMTRELSNWREEMTWSEVLWQWVGGPPK
jgi:hypothetical protein